MPRQNLLPAERTTLKNLGQQNDIIIIKPADKESAVVMLSRQDYINQTDRQLNGMTYYQQLTPDPTSQHTSEVTNLGRQCLHEG